MPRKIIPRSRMASHLRLGTMKGDLGTLPAKRKQSSPNGCQCSKTRRGTRGLPETRIPWLRLWFWKIFDSAQRLPLFSEIYKCIRAKCNHIFLSFIFHCDDVTFRKHLRWLLTNFAHRVAFRIAFGLTEVPQKCSQNYWYEANSTCIHV